MHRVLLILAVLLWASPASAQKVLYSIADVGEVIPQAATRWMSPAVSGGGDAVSSSEANALYPHRVATTFTKLGVRVYQNSFSGANDATFTVRKCPAPCSDFATETVDTALTVTIPAGMTGWFEASAALSVAFAAGDYVGLRMITPTEATKTLTIGPSWLVSEPTGSGVTYHHGTFTNWNVTTGTRYTGPMGIAASSTDEPSESLKMKTAGTITHLQTWNMTARADGTTSLTLRKNGADANKVITIGAGAAVPAVHVNTTGIDTFTTDDTLTIKHTTTGTGSASYSWLQTVVDSDDDRFEIGSARVEVVAAGAATQYFSIADLNNPSTTETDVQLQAPFAMTLTALRAHTRTNTLTGNSTLTLRVNGANAASITIADTSETTWTDPGGITVNVAAGDKINFAFTPAAAGTSIELNKIMITAEDATPAGGGGRGRYFPLFAEAR